MSTQLYDVTLSIERNGIALEHPWQPFKRGDRAKAGERYPGIVLAGETDEEKQKAVAHFVNFYGIDNTLATLNATYTVICQQTADTVDTELTEKMSLKVNTPEYNAKFGELFIKYMTELTTRGETIDELKAINSVLSNEIAALVVEQQAALEAQDMPKVIALMGTIKAKSENIKRNTLTMESKARPRKKKTDAEVPAEVTA